MLWNVRVNGKDHPFPCKRQALAFVTSFPRRDLVSRVGHTYNVRTTK